MITTLFSFLFFAFVAAITPGPSNILSFTIAAQTNMRSALPFVLASCASASLILFATYLGLAQVLVELPALRNLMAVVGSGWLCWMAVKLYCADITIAEKKGEIPGWTTGAALQFINPKTWMMSLSVSSLFYNPNLEDLSNSAILSSLFFLTATPCMSIWAGAGAFAARMFQQDRYARLMNQGLSLALLLSVLWINYDNFTRP